MFRLFECCALSFFERFVLSFSLKIERFVSDSAEIWICGLYYRVKEDDLQKVMEDYGTVSSVKFIMDRATGRFRGIAFVEMEDSAAAAKAISELDGAEFFGRQMVVKEARPPKY